MTVEDIKKAIKGTEYEHYGIRVDAVEYSVGDTANNSHQLYQDPILDDNGELVYPYIEDGQYAGFYDGGELNGTCAIYFDPEDEDSIKRALNTIDIYCGDSVHVLGGDYAMCGCDESEIIIEDACVLGKWRMK